MHARVRRTLVTAALAGLTPLAAAQQVIVVDKAGGGDFTSLNAAVAAAASGDTLLVKSGSYGSGEVDAIVVDGKSLVVIGDGPTRPKTSKGIEVVNLPSDGFFVVRGLEITGSVTPAMSCADVDGTVWIEDCRLVGSGGFGFALLCEEGYAALDVSGCAAVTVLRSTLEGGHGADDEVAVLACHDSQRGGPALRVAASALTLHESQLVGGRGGYGHSDEGAPGGPGLHAVDASLVLAGVTVTGGPGGQPCAPAFASECQGGAGLVLDGGTLLTILETSFDGGTGGLLDGGGVAPSGADESVTGGDLLYTWPGTARSLVVGSPVREGELTSVRYEGEQGDTIGLFFGFAPGYVPLLGKQGVFALGVPFVGPVFVATVTAPDGVFEVPFVGWDLTSFPLESLEAYGQCFLLPAGGGAARLSSPTAMTVLSAAF
ncbi:MAG: hypothetical protein H6825_01855 [Planctomycetes bacterium]|nr:hypothetical protein [Planctomycetota bacterium]